jgi:[acyl-carrier-protein] S-malonyltransferase
MFRVVIMTKALWAFPGQGSQVVGMGLDLLDHTSVKAKFDEAEQILGWSVAEVCGSELAVLSETRYTQPCMYVVETVLADLLRAKGETPAFVAGHSLGEYAALYAAGVFDFATGLRLIAKRAELMSQAHDGLMAALLGFDAEQLAQALANNPDVVLANDNNSGQVVISGTPEAVEATIAHVKCKKAVKLNVSGAFHSPLMADPADKFAKLLETVTFQDAQVPVLSNVDPRPATDGTLIKQRLAEQMTGSVRWREITLSLPELGVDRVVEVGPGKVLVGIMKRTCGDLAYANHADASTL